MEDQIAVLRNKLHKLSVQSDMRKKIIGGISEEDVTTYVSSIWQHFEQIENAYKQRIDEIQSSKDGLGKELNRYKQQTEKKIGELQEAVEKANKESSYYLDQCGEKDEIISQLNEKQTSEINRLVSENQKLRAEQNKLLGQISILEKDGEVLKASKEQALNEKDVYLSKIVSLEEQLSVSGNRLDESLAAYQELEEQLEEMKACVATDKDMEALLENIVTLEGALKESQSKTAELEDQLEESQTMVKTLEEKVKNGSNDLGFSSHIQAIYEQLGNLKEQVTTIDQLQQELELERLRAEKAEQDKDELSQWVMGLKDRLQKDQRELEVQFTDIEGKYRNMQDDVDGLRTNLENFRTMTSLEIQEFYDNLENTSRVLDDKQENTA